MTDPQVPPVILRCDRQQERNAEGDHQDQPQPEQGSGISTGFHFHCKVIWFFWVDSVCNLCNHPFLDKKRTLSNYSFVIMSFGFATIYAFQPIASSEGISGYPGRIQQI